MYSGIIAACFHPIWCYIFVSKSMLDMGIKGLGLANLITYSLCFAVNLIYSSCIPEIRKSIFLPDRRIFHDLGEYFSLGLPGAFMICIEVYGYIMIDIVSGWISVTCQSGQVILVQICIHLYGISLGLE
jgi:Na+-driven multidrug efflux pump